jgi:hypothetical protein
MFTLTLSHDFIKLNYTRQDLPIRTALFRRAIAWQLDKMGGNLQDRGAFPVRQSPVVDEH